MTEIDYIPIQTLSDMLSGLGYAWHSPDYYISADQVINAPPSAAPFRPDFYGLILCVQGWLDLTVNSELVHIDTHHFFAGGPNMIFQRTGQSANCKTNAIYFTKAFLLKNHVNAHQLEAFEFFSHKPQPCIPLTKEDAEPLVKLYDILKDKRAGHDAHFQLEIVRNLFFAYVYEAALLYQRKGHIVPEKYTREIDIAYKFQQLLTKHCTREHHLKFYAEALFISEKYLIHVIKRSAGKTPGKLIDEAIISEARIRLKDPKRSIAGIAEDLQFSDQASFAKFFKKHTTQTPSEFRRVL
jgi:AraC-like DNA-binding protein